MRSQTFNAYAIFRAISKTSSGEDVAKAIALVKQLKIYPLTEAANPPETRFLDMYGQIFDAVLFRNSNAHAATRS